MNQSQASLIEALERVGAALDDVVRELLLDDAARAMTDAETRALAPLVESVGRRADALRVTVAGEVDDRSRLERGEARMSAQHGCANAAELLTRLTQISATTARDRIRLARSIATTTALSGDTLPARFPAVRVALAAGSIGLDTASIIIMALAPIVERANPADLHIAEQELVAAAAGGDDAPPLAADDTQIQARVWALVLDPDGTLPAYERAMRRRGLTLSREIDGLVPIRGMLLPDVAEQFRRLSDAHLSPRVEDRTQPATGPAFVDDADVDDGSPVVPHDRRSLAQKQHDVLASVLGVAARAAETPTLGGAAPTLLVTIQESELHTHDGIAFIEGTETTVPAFVARQIACCGGIQRLIFGDDGQIVELGGPQRVFTAHQRRAITARDGGCIIPGCRVRATWCEVHHVIEHSRGGPTHTDNGVLLCWFHHRTLETSGWKVRVADGVPETKAPYSMDPYVMWRPATGSMHRQRERLRERIASR